MLPNKLFAILILTVILEASLTATPINVVLGDIEPDQISGNLIESHLNRVQHVLRSNVTNSKRLQMLECLRNYTQGGRFPTKFHYESQDPSITRIPCFIDDNGVNCAVAQLMTCSGYKDLTQNINKQWRFNYLYEMINDASNIDLIIELKGWSEAVGLNMTELAMIQPTYKYKNDEAKRRREGNFDEL